MISHQHESVMLKQTIDGLDIHADGCYVDATLGRGGHTQAILEKLGDNGRLISFDRDQEAIDYVTKNISDTRLTLVHSAFSELTNILEEKELFGQVDGILWDFGVSSPQLDNAHRGFSFQNEGPLDMRMDTRQNKTAANWLAQASEKEIADVLYQFGEEKKSWAIARAIKAAQEKVEITSTIQLANIVASVVSSYKQKKHPATRTFQALRIYVNQELTQLQTALKQGLACLAHDGRMVMLSFHSLEDRLVKQFIQKHSKAKTLPRHLPIMAKQVEMPLKSISRTFASKEEIAQNIRSRSAVLRVAQKVSVKMYQ